MFRFNQLANANLSRSKYGIQENFFAVWLAVTNEEGGITVKCKQSLALLLAGALLLPANAFAADLSQFKDFPNDWSSKSLERAIDDGLLNGSNGQINAKGLLTRAQMAAIVARAFGATKSASLSSYKDVLPSAWYYSDMGKAVKMGAFQGANGLLNPDAPITREEAFTVLARAFALEGGGSATLKDFVDGGTVSSWASESVAALVAGGYVNGANGMLNLKNNITRAEFAKVITGMAASYVGAEGVSGKTVEGNMIVRESGASLSGMTINGDLIIADSADKVSLDNVKVTGRIVIRGGADAVGIKDTTAGKGVLVSSPNGAAAISVSGGSVGTVTAKSDLSLSGSVSNVAVTDKATLTVEKNASVGTVTVSAAGSKITGDGKVTNVQANANNVTVTNKGTKVTAGSGVSGVKAGDKTVSSGKTETVGTASSSGGSSSGGSSSSRSDYSYVLMNIPYNEFYKAELSENAPAVDAVSSATKNKTRIGTLAGGSYHVKSDGTDITGVTYPVRVKTSDLSGLKQVTDSDSVSITASKDGEAVTSTYNGRDALFENASYSYYVLSSTPSYYKEATLTNGRWSFGKATGAVSEDTATISKFKISGNHADYEMTVKNDKIEKAKKDKKKVYAVVLTATDGSSCGLHHVTEIWKVAKLGFSANSALAGKTISAVTYYTEDGIIKLNLDKKLYVPTHAATVEADFSSGETAVSFDFPSDFDAAYSVTVDDKESDFFQCDPKNHKVTWNPKAEAPSGTCQLVITDKKGAYAPELVQINLNVYAYAAVPYDEYWKSEGVYLSGDNWKASSDVADNDSYKYNGLTLSEYDKGAFDAVSRATARHGIHRGSFQQDMVFHTTEGVDLEVAYWNDATSLVLADGRTATFAGIKALTSTSDPIATITVGNTTYHMTGSELKGIKYVPVKVKASDFADFKKAYTVVENGGTLTGGYTEEGKDGTTTLVGFHGDTALTAAVTSNTNGLKEVTKGEGNTFSFGARQTGTDSGIKDTELKTVDKDNIKVEPQKFSGGTYGSMFRVHLTGSAYGDLGSRMQSVTWQYYGDSETVLQTYGTKFAADIWMHGNNGIQLGLTKSLRAELPEGTDGTGKWVGTIHALGYKDFTFTVKLAAENVRDTGKDPMTADQKTQLTELKEQAGALLENYVESKATDAEKALKAHYDEADALLKNEDATTTAAANLLGKLPGLIKAVEDERKQPTKPDKPTTETKTITGTIKPADDAKGHIEDAYNFSFEITLQDGTIIGFNNDTTDAGDDNASYWKKATQGDSSKNIEGMFTKLLNKKASEIDGVDVVSKATVSSNAIKKAVKNALSNN